MQINGGWNSMLRERVQRPSPAPWKLRTFEKVLPREQVLSERQITQNFI